MSNMFDKIVMFAMSIASKGLTNKTIDLPTKQLRILSCFGDKDIPPCHHLKSSTTSKYHYCGGCGCGDKKGTWLLKQNNEYAKLDYPVLNCPLKMPGFTNYDPNYVTPECKQRKDQIHKFDPEKLQYIQATINSNQLIENGMSKINKILKNS